MSALISMTLLTVLLAVNTAHATEAAKCEILVIPKTVWVRNVSFTGKSKKKVEVLIQVGNFWYTGDYLKSRAIEIDQGQLHQPIKIPNLASIMSGDYKEPTEHYYIQVTVDGTTVLSKGQTATEIKFGIPKANKTGTLELATHKLRSNDSVVEIALARDCGYLIHN